ncbi:MAG: GNAT family N-acetyltransferase [Terriglobia bacterium]
MPTFAEASTCWQIETNPPLTDALHELLVNWTHKPYGYCPAVTATAQATYVLNSLVLSQRQNATTYLARNNGQPHALLQLQSLPWDTKLLGFPVARISWWIARDGGEERRRDRAVLLRVALSQARQQGIRYLLARVPAGDLEGVHLLEENGFQLVDALLTFGMSPLAVAEQRPETGEVLPCDRARADDLPALREIARSSFSLDRFHADPAIPQATCDEVHCRWLEDSCAAQAGCVLVARAGEPVGFTTLKVDKGAQAALGMSVGLIVLVATSARQRRKGVAGRLTAGAINWFRAAGCGWVEVGTQLANLKACRVYQSAGFNVVGSSFTFRRLL